MIVSYMISFSTMDSLLSYFQVYHWGDNDLIFKVSTGFRVVNFRQNKLMSGTVQVFSPISICVCQIFFSKLNGYITETSQRNNKILVILTPFQGHISCNVKS